METHSGVKSACLGTHATYLFTPIYYQQDSNNGHTGMKGNL